MTQFAIEQRTRVLVNTDPEGRCYNGCNFSEEHRWSGWQRIHTTTNDNALGDLEFWRDFESARTGKCEFRARRLA